MIPVLAVQRIFIFRSVAEVRREMKPVAPKPPSSIRRIAIFKQPEESEIAFGLSFIKSLIGEFARRKLFIGSASQKNTELTLARRNQHRGALQFEKIHQWLKQSVSDQFAITVL